MRRNDTFSTIENKQTNKKTRTIAFEGVVSANLEGILLSSFLRWFYWMIGINGWVRSKNEDSEIGAYLKGKEMN